MSLQILHELQQAADSVTFHQSCFISHTKSVKLNQSHLISLVLQASWDVPNSPGIR